MIALPVPSLRAIGAGLVLVIVVGAGVWTYQSGKDAGRAEIQSQLDTSNKNLDGANAQIGVLSRKLDDQTASIEEAKRKAVEAQKVAVVAEAAAEATKKDADQKAQTWQQKLDAATKAPQCAVLTMPLCDEVSDY